MTASSETAPAHARNFIELSFRYVFQESKPVCSIAYWGIFPRIGFGKNGTGSDGHAGIYIDIQRRPLHAARVLSSASLPEGAPSVSKAPVRLLHELFSLQAARSPNSVAVVCDSTRLTYAELNQLSDRVAAQLAANGVGRNDCVAFLLERSPWVYVALLGILKAGAAYVPLDPDYPPDRIQFILGDCHAAGLLVSPELRHKCSAFSGCVLEVTAQSIHQMSGESRAFQPASQSQPEDLCYVIYTSGTTGRPKGVQIEHHSACHFVQTESRLFGIHSTDRVFQGFSIAFDASVEEIWLALANGATLVVGTSEVIHSGPGLSRWLAEAHVTVLSCVPTLLATLEEDVPDLRLLILGGEVCPPSLVRKWWKPGRVVINTYGPTEATVVATWAVCAPDKPVTIGRPLPGCIAVVVDESLNPVEGSEPGELLIGGAGVARGYLGRPELTAEKFIMYSFAQEAAKRFYRTGDRVRWTADGELEFLGRIDAQVKIRGFRVELSEIESVLVEAPEVQAAAVTLHGERLAAFVVQEPGATLSTPLLKARLRDRLPGYMIPASIEVLPALPTLPSGKIDRKALPVPSSPDRAGRPELIRPRNLCERQLVEMWSKHFGTADISITDDFFLDLGGHSLLAARTVSELRLIPGFELLSVADLYRWPTAGQLSEEIQKRWREAKLPANAAAAETKNGPRAVAVPFWRHFLCGLGQLFSLVFVLGFFALQWLAPYLTYTVMVEEDYDGMTSILAAFASLVLLYPVMLSVAIVLKWAVIGRYKPGNYPLWGWYYFRFWLVTAVESTVPVSYLSGTPLLNIYLRLMGAKIGRNVFIHSDNFAIYDLLAIGDGTSVNADAALLGYTVSGGRLTIGAITIGSGCFVGARAAVAPNTAIADGGELEDLSLLPSGQSIGCGETWAGSPARRTAGPNSSTGSAMSEANGNESDGFAYTAAQALGLLIFPVLVVAALFPGIAVMNRLNYLDPYYWYLLLSPLIAVSFVSLLCLEIVLLKWVLLGKIKAGQHSLRSWYYVRKWFVDKTMELSLDVVGPLYASVYLSPWYKLLGAKLGHGAEIS
ncbi:MAG TPA: amino acid adenylation domain-containing protein, partial [Verrucomicrobiae bacterium]|nr:amino acid adenylation domain-containing protein [Verrucomicrobiae bacterium]